MYLLSGDDDNNYFYLFKSLKCTKLLTQTSASFVECFSLCQIISTGSSVICTLAYRIHSTRFRTLGTYMSLRKFVFSVLNKSEIRCCEMWILYKSTYMNI